MIASAAAFLGTHKSHRRLGKPGVRVETKSMYGFDELVPTNAPFVVGSNRVALPERVLDFHSRDELIGRITVKTLPQDTTFGRRLYFRTNEPPILCQVVLMGADRTSIHKPQYCLKGMGLQTVSTQPLTVPVNRPYRYELPVMRLNLRGEVRDAEGKSHVASGVFVYWFVADGELTSSHVDRMWWMARDLMLSGVLQRWAYVICFTPCAVGSEDAAFERLKEFIAAAVPEFQLTAGPRAGGERAAADRNAWPIAFVRGNALQTED
jgi:hypothetical protein